MGITFFIVGHVTKEGTVAGPRVLEHMVDTVLYFEGDRYAIYRILRGVKNRFGSTNEIGIFEMRAEGLVGKCSIPLNTAQRQASWSKRLRGDLSMEGTRPVLTEVQALIVETNFRIYPGETVNRYPLTQTV